MKHEQKWEYKVIDSRCSDADLNAEAAEGWEFMQALTWTTSGGAIRFSHYFRREHVPAQTLLDAVLNGGVGETNIDVPGGVHLG